MVLKNYGSGESSPSNCFKVIHKLGVINTPSPSFIIVVTYRKIFDLRSKGFGGFLAQKFNRRTALKLTTKLTYEALNPPLRQTAVGGSLFFFCSVVSIFLGCCKIYFQFLKVI